MTLNKLSIQWWTVMRTWALTGLIKKKGSNYWFLCVVYCSVVLIKSLSFHFLMHCTLTLLIYFCLFVCFSCFLELFISLSFNIYKAHLFVLHSIWNKFYRRNTGCVIKLLQLSRPFMIYLFFQISQKREAYLYLSV